MIRVVRPLLPLLLLGPTMSAWARPLPAGVTVDDIAAAFERADVAVEIARDASGEGTARVRGTVDGVPFLVRFFGCNGAARCASVQLFAGYDLPQGTTPEKINLWNAEYRFGRAYLDAEMDPYVALDADFQRGATTEAVENVAALWVALMTGFRAYIAPA